MITFSMLSSEGTSNITSIIISSMIERSPRAPVLRSMALAAMAFNASGSNSNLVSSRDNNFWYCFTKAFFGSVKIRTKSSFVNLSSAAITGKRPINSGINPNFKRSSVVTSAKETSLFSLSSGIICCMMLSSSFKAELVLPKPIVFSPKRFLTMVSIPSNAPPAMKRTFVVSIWINSWCGCLRPPCGGTLATVPSRIFSKACWTPSPETSRVIETFSLLRAILSISSI